jgi:ribosomal protein S18 acetylase RimI-like enzyme
MATQGTAVSIRAYRSEDYVDTVRIWELGFLEMGASLYSETLRWPVLAVLGAATVGAYAASSLTAAYVGVALGLAWLSPLGRVAVESALWRGILAESSKTMSRDMLQSKWTRPPHAFFIAELEGRVVGCVAVRCGEHTLYKERARSFDSVLGEFFARQASVWRLSVDSSVRRLGVGRMLMEKAEAHAARAGCTSISLITANPASRRFYERLGYSFDNPDEAARVVFGPSLRPLPWSVLGWLRFMRLQGRLKRTILAKRLPVVRESGAAVDLK